MDDFKRRSVVQHHVRREEPFHFAPARSQPSLVEIGAMLTQDRQDLCEELDRTMVGAELPA